MSKLTEVTVDSGDERRTVFPHVEFHNCICNLLITAACQTGVQATVEPPLQPTKPNNQYQKSNWEYFIVRSKAHLGYSHY